MRQVGGHPQSHLLTSHTSNNHTQTLHSVWMKVSEYSGKCEYGATRVLSVPSPLTFKVHLISLRLSLKLFSVQLWYSVRGYPPSSFLLSLRRNTLLKSEALFAISYLPALPAPSRGFHPWTPLPAQRFLGMQTCATNIQLLIRGSDHSLSEHIPRHSNCNCCT